MQRIGIARWKGARGFAVVATLAVLLAMVGTAASASTVAHKKKLRLANVVLTGGTSGTDSSIWVAQGEGFFKQEGLNFTYLPSASNARQAAALISGSAQFAVDNASSDFSAVEQGAPLRAVAQVLLGAPNEIVISQAAANQFGVPSSASTPAGATAQFRALKGSHITLGESTTSSASYYATSYLAHLTG